ncbi:MAG: pyridoxamine 5'-phosphate oxidase family protein [Acidobacteriota bacterium]
MDWKTLSLELMKISEVVCVTTINADGYPETRAMFNLLRQEQFPGLQSFLHQSPAFTVFLTTNTSSRKLQHLRTNPRASVYYCAPLDWRGLDLVGNLIEITDQEIKKNLWQPGWELYYPGGWEDPDYSVLLMTPHHARYYHQLDCVDFEP